MKAKPSVKGTTKVSFGDRLLIKKLYMADRNSKQKKQRRSKEISQDYKIQVANAPHRKAQEAYQHWLKKARDKELNFEFQESDDILAVTAMCQPEWETLCQRQLRMQSFRDIIDAALEKNQNSSRSSTGNSAEKGIKAAVTQAKKAEANLAPSASVNTVEEKAINLLQRLSKIIDHDCTFDLPLLNAGRHKRASNYRRKIFRKRNLLDAHVSRRDFDVLSALDGDACGEVTSNLCEPVPACDYDACEPSIYYTCSACSEPVCSTEMHVEHNGAFDAIFFHHQCFETKSL